MQTQHAVLAAAPHVAVDQQRAIARVREGEREIARQERLPLAHARTGHGDEQRSGAPGVAQAQPQAAQRLDHRRRRLGRLAVAEVAPVEPGHGTQNGQAHLVRHVLGVAHLVIEPVEHHHPEHAQAKAHDERRAREQRRPVAVRPVGGRSAVEDAHVGQRAHGRQLRLVVALLHGREQLLCDRDVALQPRLLQRQRRQVVEIAERGVGAAPELLLARRQVGVQPPRQRRNRVPQEGLHLTAHPLHRLARLRIPVAQRPQRGLLRGQLLQGERQLGRLLHRADRLEGLDRRARVALLGQRALERLAIALHRVERQLGVERALEHRVAPTAQGGRDGRRALTQHAGAPHAEVALRRFCDPQAAQRVLALLVQNSPQLHELDALQVGGDDHHAIRDRVHGGRQLRRPAARELNAQEVGVGPRPHQRGVDVGGHTQRLHELPRGVRRRAQHEVYRMARRNQPRAGTPAEPEPPALPHRPVERVGLDHAAGVLECEGPPLPVDRVAIGAGDRGPVEVQRRQQGRIPQVLRAQVQPPLPHHFLQHGVRLHQVDPPGGVQQLVGLGGRPGVARRGRSVLGLEPKQRRCRVGGVHQPAGEQSHSGAQESDRDHSPLPPADRAEIVLPVGLARGATAGRDRRRQRRRSHPSAFDRRHLRQARTLRRHSPDHRCKGDTAARWKSLLERCARRIDA